jgi:hypothetical protein
MNHNVIMTYPYGTIISPGSNDCVIEVDKMNLFHFKQIQENLVGSEFSFKPGNNQFAHVFLLCRDVSFTLASVTREPAPWLVGETKDGKVQKASAASLSWISMQFPKSSRQYLK